MEEKMIGVIAHYYGHLGVGIINLEQEGLRIGDTLHFKGRTTDFQQTVESIQIEHIDVQEAQSGDSVGVKVNEQVREHDQVFKVIA